MTERELKQKAFLMYCALWGDAWIAEHRNGIYDSTWVPPDKDGQFYFYLTQSDEVAASKPATTFEEFYAIVSAHNEDPFEHCTTFLCDLKTGEVVVEEHY